MITENGKVNWTKQTALDDKHCNSPRPGDYWSEMLAPILVVIAVRGERVRICRKIKPVDSDSWTWDLEKSEVMSCSELSGHVHYDTMPDKCWCQVSPRAHKWVIEAYAEVAV